MIAEKTTELELLIKDNENIIRLTWNDILQILQTMIYFEPGTKIQLKGEP